MVEGRGTRWAVVFMVIILTMALAGCRGPARESQDPAAPGGRATGQVESLQISELKSAKMVNFPEDYRGEKVLLTFFSTS